MRLYHYRNCLDGLQRACLARWHAHNWESSPCFTLSRPRQWGKTTFLAKLSHMLPKEDLCVLLGYSTKLVSLKKRYFDFRSTVEMYPINDDVSIHGIDYNDYHLFVDDADCMLPSLVDNLVSLNWKTITVTKSE